jgi:hypothetical protein
MLPDFPKLKAKAEAHLLQFIQREIPRVEPLLEKVRSFSQHEGRSGHLHRPDGSEDTIEYPGAEFGTELPREFMRTLDVPAVIQHLRSIAEQIAAHQTKMMLTKVGEAAAAVGNEISAGGGEFKREHLLELLQKVETEFDPVTGARKPGQAFVMHPDMADKILPRMQEWEKDPAFLAKVAEIENDQREKWRAREARRILAD